MSFIHNHELHDVMEGAGTLSMPLTDVNIVGMKDKIEFYVNEDDSPIAQLEVQDGKLRLVYWRPGNDQEGEILELEEPARRREWIGDCDYCLEFDTSVHADDAGKLECDDCEDNGAPEWEFDATGPADMGLETFFGYSLWDEASDAWDRLKAKGYTGLTSIRKSEETKICDFCPNDDGRRVSVNTQGLHMCKKCKDDQ